MLDQPQQSGDETSGGQLFEFVDHAHEVTEEERNRPRYGRPQRKPQPQSQPEPPNTQPRQDGATP